MSRLFAEELPGPARSLHPGHASAGASCASPAAGIATPGTTAMPPTGRTLQPMGQTERLANQHGTAPWPWRNVALPAVLAGMHLVNFVASRRWRWIAALSLRLPDHLEQQLNEEAQLSGQPRSQLMREALETLLSQRREGREQAALKLAAGALASDAGACAEAREISADFLLAENEALAGAEGAANATSAEVWWR